MISTGTKNIGHGEFVGEFLYQLYREIACYGYDCYGNFDWSLMTEDQRTMHRAFNTVSFRFDDAARTSFGRTNEFTWDEEI